MLSNQTQPADLNGCVLEMPGGETRESEGVLGQRPPLPNSGKRCHWVHRKVKTGENEKKTHPVFKCVCMRSFPLTPFSCVALYMCVVSCWKSKTARSGGKDLQPFLRTTEALTSLPELVRWCWLSSCPSRGWLLQSLRWPAKGMSGWSNVSNWTIISKMLKLN